MREINDVTSNIANAISQQDLSTREISRNAQLAASVLTASSDLTATAETLSREVEKLFHDLRADPVDALKHEGI